jgi:hypothetical protein
MRTIALLAAILLMASPSVSAQLPDTQFRQWSVCIEPEQEGYTFSSQTPVDFMLVDIFRGEAPVARLYLGNFPSIQQDELREAHGAAKEGLFAPLSRRSHQYVAFPEAARQPIIHLMFAADVSAEERHTLIRSIRYCDAQ